MTTQLPLGVLLPFALALVPALLPMGISPRRLGVCALSCAGLTLLLAVCCAVPVGPAWLTGAEGAWRGDGLARTMATLPGFGWMLVALRALQPGEAVRPVQGRWRRWPVAGQLMTACAMAACRADLLALLPVLLGVLLLLAHRDGTTGRERAVVLAAVPVMGFGVSVLSVVVGAPARWSLLATATASGRTQTVGLLMLLVPVLLVSVLATLRPALVVRPGVLRGLSRTFVIVVVLLVALRCCAAAPLKPPVLWFGFGAIALSLGLLPVCRDLSARLALAVAFQTGVALVAVAVGGAGGVASAVMLAGFLSLLLPLALWFPVDAGSARFRLLAIVVLVGLPPFGPFAAGLVLLVRAWATAPAIAVVVLLAAALSAVSVLDAAAREPAASPGWRMTAWFGCVAIVLLAVLWLGLAMPVALSDRLLSIGAVRS